jgi:hypothetical protein
MATRTAFAASLFCALAVHALPAKGQSGPPHQMRYQLTAGELAELCREDRADDAQTMRNLICAGYITGIRDGVEVGAAPTARGQTLFCLPSGFSRDDSMRLFRDYIAARPERSGLPAAMVVALAFKERHPCPAQPVR